MSNQNQNSRDDRNRDPRDERRTEPPRDQKQTKHQFRDGDRVKVRCVDFDMGFTSEKSGSKEQLGLALEITDGQAKGFTLSTYLFFTETAAEYSLKKMAALGWNGDWNNLETLKSEEASATIEIERTPDGDQVRVGWINRAGVAMKEKMNQTQKAAFADRMKGITKRVLGTGNANSNDDRKLGTSGGRGAAPPQEGGYDYRRDQQQGSARGSDRYGDAPPPSDDDRPPYERGGNSGRRW